MKDSCPLCGHPLDGTGGYGGFKSVPGSVFGAGAQMPAGTEFVRREPSRPASVQSDVVVNVLYAVISWLAIAVAGCVVAVLAWDWRAAAWGLVIGLVIGLVLWFTLLWESRRHLWKEERIKGRKVEDEKTVKSVRTVRVATVDDRGNGRGSVLYDELGVEEEVLIGVARLMMEEGGTFSRRSVTPGIIAESFYKELRKRLLVGGLLRQIGESENSPVVVTSKGAAVFRELLGEESPPTEQM